MSIAHYEIVVEVRLDPSRWSRWFEGMDVTVTDNGHTVISGPVADQAALHGLLAQVRDLGLVLVSVQRTDPGKIGQLNSEKE